MARPLCSIIKMFTATLLLFSGSTFAFSLSGLSTITPRVLRSPPLHAKKPTRMNGIGGLPGSSATGSKKSPKQVSNAKSSSAKNGTSKSVFERPKMSNETPLASILLAFLNPLRNPNSLFLYLLVIVSVLGKMNENNVGN